MRQAIGTGLTRWLAGHPLGAVTRVAQRHSMSARCLRTSWMAWKLSIRQKTDLGILAPAPLAHPVGGADCGDGGAKDRRGSRPFQRFRLHLFCPGAGGGHNGFASVFLGIGLHRQSGQRDWEATAVLDSLQPAPPDTDHHPQTPLPPALPRAARPSRLEQDPPRRPLAPTDQPLQHPGRKTGQPRLPTDGPLLTSLPQPAL